jgi:hypothetical protein
VRDPRTPGAEKVADHQLGALLVVAHDGRGGGWGHPLEQLGDQAVNGVRHEGLVGRLIAPTHGLRETMLRAAAPNSFNLSILSFRRSRLWMRGARLGEVYPGVAIA